MDKKELMRAVKFTLFSISAGIIQLLSFTLMNEVFHWELLGVLSDGAYIVGPLEFHAQPQGDVPLG